MSGEVRSSEQGEAGSTLPEPTSSDPVWEDDPHWAEDQEILVLTHLSGGFMKCVPLPTLGRPLKTF